MDAFANYCRQPRLKIPGDDRTYDKLLEKLAQKKFDGVTPAIRENILDFYHAMKSPDEHGIGAELDALRAYRPERGSGLREVR